MSEDFAVQNHCTACGSDLFESVGRPGPALDVEVGGRFFHQPSFEARSCRNCNLVFKSNTLSPEAFADYYRRVDFGKWEIPGLFPTERKILTLLEELPTGSRILDYGCSTGRLLTALSGDYQKFGLEINQNSSQIAATKGITIIPTDAIDRPPRTLLETFDTIVMVDVFEHLVGSTELLRKLAAYLLPGGRLILCTGNSDAKAVRGEPAQFWYLQIIEHVCSLNPTHAAYLSGALGLQLIRIDMCSHYDSACQDILMHWVYRQVYDIFHGGPRPLAMLLGLLPRVKRARHWVSPPAWVGSRDHLILVYRKP